MMILGSVIKAAYYNGLLWPQVKKERGKRKAA